MLTAWFVPGQNGSIYVNCGVFSPFTRMSPHVRMSVRRESIHVSVPFVASNTTTSTPAALSSCACRRNTQASVVA